MIKILCPCGSTNTTWSANKRTQTHHVHCLDCGQSKSIYIGRRNTRRQMHLDEGSP